MNNFDFGWFTTLPGLLITGGVILLSISLVILFVINKKSKKEKNPLDDGNNTNTASTVVTTNTDPNTVITDVPTGTVGGPAVATSQISQTTTPSVNPTVTTPSAQAVVPNEPKVVDPATVMAATANTDVSPVVPVIPAPDISNNVNNTNNVTPIVSPSAVSNVTANVQPMSTPVEVKPAKEVVPNISSIANNTVAYPQTQSNIYGGANPNIPSVNLNQNSTHQIYGGANPLENPQNVQKMAHVQTPNTSASIANPTVGGMNVPNNPTVTVTPNVSTNPTAPVKPVIPTIQSVNTAPVVPSVQPVISPTPSVQPVTPNLSQQPISGDNK